MAQPEQPESVVPGWEERDWDEYEHYLRAMLAASLRHAPFSHIGGLIVVTDERKRQDAIHPVTEGVTIDRWLGCLMEELGEVARAVDGLHKATSPQDVEDGVRAITEELTHVAALALRVRTATLEAW